MKVKLIASTDDLLDVIYTSARTCYNPGSPVEMFEDKVNITVANKLKLINTILKSGHESPLEHATFTFAIEGITRACSHQLVRHRLCSFSQQSQRYVTYGFLDITIPDSISNDRQAYSIFENCMDLIEHTYKTLGNLGIPAEDARAILPNCTRTNITMTCNLRELIHICNERLCNRAQGEIHSLVKQMVKQVIKKHEWLSDYLVPKCKRLKYCPEHKGCGMMKSLEEKLCK